MFSNFLIGLREGLEASLVIGIIVACVRAAGRRSELPRVWCGVGVAILMSVSFGALLTFGPRGLTFEAQETIGGALSLIAAGFLTWMIFWMQKFARDLKTGLNQQVLNSSEKNGLTLMAVAFLAVGREGLETALFLWAGAQASGSTWTPLVGGVLGVLVAALGGVAVYRGALALNLRLFFHWTGFALIVIAAGVLSYGIHDLQEAGVLPGLGNLAFDISGVISPDSWIGTLLKGSINFSPTTTWLEAMTWTIYILPIASLYFHSSHQKSTESAGGKQ